MEEGAPSGPPGPLRREDLIFWIVTLRVAVALFLAPLLTGKEPKGRRSWFLSLTALSFRYFLVNYHEHATYLTLNHGHTALFFERLNFWRIGRITSPR
ncbi:MAG TPA: hypothetical protein EYP65_00355 [Armatimonadetes bacterium]|nr:hypothetical protein [Armatimonadota bacterium]